MAFLRTSSFLKAIFFLVAATLISIICHPKPWPNSLPQDLLTLHIATKLRLDPQATSLTSTDFGRMISTSPAAAAVLYPSSPLDIATLIQFSFSSPHPFTVSARGHGHSVHGQAFAPNGVVVDMAALGGDERRITVWPSGSYVDAGGEQLWIDVLHETLKFRLAPRSWTDYLYLTVGGTLSNAGVSGQAFRHGPQISNVVELDVITGKGEMVTCSEHRNSELFFAVLGGLGQFGIITRARIALQRAPQQVRWVRLIYTDFGTFTRDQEHLISKTVFDYVEGSLLMDHSLMTNWRSSFFSAKDSGAIAALAANYDAIYCLEGAVYYDSVTASAVHQEVELLLGDLRFEPGFVFRNDVSYLSFLNRVHDGELKLRSMGLWDVPHPWLNLFVPRSRMTDFDLGVFKGIMIKHNNNSSMGPILIYPMTKNKWDERMSSVIPDEEVFYSVGLLRSASMHNWQYLEDQNTEIIRFCDEAGIAYKQYLPHYQTRDDWKKHFGPKWNQFVEMKRKYDPKALLAPGQRIFSTSQVMQHALE